MTGNEKHHTKNSKSSMRNEKETQKKKLEKLGEDICNLISEEKKVYVKYLQLVTPETRTEHRRRREKELRMK
jgi:phenylalanyl-tRNA synthetase beta subunit